MTHNPLPMYLNDGDWCRPHGNRPTTDEVLLWLGQLQSDSDRERAHLVADDILLSIVDNSDIEAAFDKVTRWCA